LSGDRTSASDLREAVGNEQDEDDESAVSGPLDLEVPEERVGTEEVEGFVDNVRFIWVRWEGGLVDSITTERESVPIGAGPLIFVRMGRTAVLPMTLRSGYSFRDE